MAVPAEGARAASPAQPRHHRAAGPAALPAELLPVFVTRAEAFKMSHTLSTRLRFAGFKVARGLEGKTFREVADIFDAPPSPRREALPHSPRRDALPDREPPGGAKRARASLSPEAETEAVELLMALSSTRASCSPEPHHDDDGDASDPQTASPARSLAPRRSSDDAPPSGPPTPDTVMAEKDEDMDDGGTDRGDRDPAPAPAPPAVPTTLVSPPTPANADAPPPDEPGAHGHPPPAVPLPPTKRYRQGSISS